MPITLQMTINGLMGYVIDEKCFDVLMLASREIPGAAHGHHAHADQHTPALLLPMGRLEDGGSAPDLVLDAGLDAEEYGVWFLNNSFVELRADGQAPANKVKFSKTGGGTTPKPNNEKSLFWLANVSKAAMMTCSFRADCRPPHPNPHLVAGAIRIAEGEVVAYWSSEDAKKDVWDFQLRGDDKGSKENAYTQALADGIVWTVKAQRRIELLLHSLEGHAMRTLVFEPTMKEALHVKGAVSNKPATVDGRPPYEERADEIHHYLLYYDVVEPAPPLTSRRVPVAFDVSTKDSRCPGSAG